MKTNIVEINRWQMTQPPKEGGSKKKKNGRGRCWRHVSRLRQSAKRTVWNAIDRKKRRDAKRQPNTETMSFEPIENWSDKNPPIPSSNSSSSSTSSSCSCSCSNLSRFIIQMVWRMNRMGYDRRPTEECLLLRITEFFSTEFFFATWKPTLLPSFTEFSTTWRSFLKYFQFCFQL